MPDHFTPGPTTTTEAEALSLLLQEFRVLKEKVDGERDHEPKDIPVLLTDYSPTTGAYSWIEQVGDSVGKRYDKLNGLFGDSTNRPAFSLNGDVFNVSPTAPMEAWIREFTVTESLGPVYEITTGAAAAPGGFWARLLTKCYPGEDCYACDGLQAFIQYTFTPVADSTDPGCISWYEGTAAGLIAYEVNNIDVPVTPNCSEEETGDPHATDDCPTIVWMRQSDTGNYFLFDSQPRWEFVERTSDTLTLIDGAYYFDGVLMRYNQVTKGFTAVELVWILDATAP